MAFKHRDFPLVFTSEGHFDPTWLLCIVITLTGAFAVVWETVRQGHASMAGWAFLGSAHLALLIAAVPIAKARLLASLKAAAPAADSDSAAASESSVADADADGGSHA